MYSIYSITGDHKVCLHDDLVADPTVKVLDPKLKLSDSNAGSLQFKLAPNNIGYGNYEVTEKTAKGVKNSGDPIVLVNRTGQEPVVILKSGNINQNGEEIADATSLITDQFLQKGNSNSLKVSVSENSVAYTDRTIYQGISPDSSSSKSLFQQGYIQNGSDVNSSYAIRTIDQYAYMIKVNSGDVINVKATGLGTYASDEFQYQLYFYNESHTLIEFTAQRINCGTSYTIPASVGSGKYMRITITNNDRSRYAPLASITPYVHINDINYTYYPASSGRNAHTSLISCHTDFIKIQDEGGSLKEVRLYHKLSLNPYATYSEFEQGSITRNDGKIEKDDTDTNAIRLYIPYSDLAGDKGYHATPQMKYSISYESEYDNLKIEVFNVGSDGETSYDYVEEKTLDESYVLTQPIVVGNGGFWIVLRKSDHGSIVPEDITSMSVTFKPILNGYYIYAGVQLYLKQQNGEYKYLRSTNPIVATSIAADNIFNAFNDINLAYSIDASHVVYATHVSIEYRIEPINNGGFVASLNPEMFNTVRTGISTPFKYGLAQYDSNYNFIRIDSFARSSSVSFSPICTKYKITIQFEDDSEITVDSIDAATAQEMALNIEETTKKLDLVSRLTSTIKVMRSEWGLSKDNNGEFSLLSPVTITSLFEQGTLNPDGSDHPTSYYIRSSLIELNLIVGDHISINGILREAGSTSETEVSSTARRPANYILHLYENGTHIGLMDNGGFGYACDTDITIPDDFSEYTINGIRVIILASDRDKVSKEELDFATLYSTKSVVSNADINQLGAEFASDYTVTTSMLPLIRTANTSANDFWTAQIDAQSRQGIAFVWGVAMYDSYRNYIAMQRWLDQNTRFDGIRNGTKYIRIILKYKGLSTSPNGIELPANDISVLNVKCLKMTNNRTEHEIWEGRVLSEDVDFKNCRVIYCEGELAYLNDTRQVPRVYQGVTFRNYISKLLEAHNAKAPAERRFTLGTTWEPTKRKDDEYGNTDPNDDITRHVTNFETTLECINALVSDFGGHLRIRKSGSIRYLDWLEDYPQNSSQVIRFGSNLLDFTRKYDMSKFCTAVYPTGTVLVSAKSTAVGDHVPMTSGVWDRYENTLLYQDENDGRVYMNRDQNLNGYLTVIATVDSSKITDGKLEEKVYYFSGRLHGGFVAYWITDTDNNMYQGCIEIAGDERPDTGFVDYVDKEIVVPVMSGKAKIWMCSFGSAIPLALKTQTKETTGLDELLTITDCNTDKDSSGKVWHTKGSPYITNPAAVEKYGWIEHRLDLANLKDKDALYNAAKKYIQSGQFEEINLEVSAIDLNSLGANTEYINLLDKVRVISEPHGLDQYFPVTEIDIPLNNPADQKFRLGNKNEVNLTYQHASSNTELLQKIEQAPSSESVVRTALENAATAIATATSGSYINYLYDDNGHMKELIISENAPADASDPTTISNGSVWRWNNEGLAHSNGGYNPVEFAKEANIAITKQGQVIANEILGQFLYGYLIGSGKMVVGNAIGGTQETVASYLPSDIGENGSAISIIGDADSSNPNANRSYVDMYKGMAKFGIMKPNKEREETGRINGVRVQSEGQNPFRALVVESQGDKGIVVLNASNIWVGSGGDGFEDVAYGFTGEFEDANGYTIKVKNGIIIQ